MFALVHHHLFTLFCPWTTMLTGITLDLVFFKGFSKDLYPLFIPMKNCDLILWPHPNATGSLNSHNMGVLQYQYDKHWALLLQNFFFASCIHDLHWPLLLQKRKFLLLVYMYMYSVKFDSQFYSNSNPRLHNLKNK